MCEEKRKYLHYLVGLLKGLVKKKTDIVLEIVTRAYVFFDDGHPVTVKYLKRCKINLY